MPSNRGTFQGNLAGTGSRILEMLTSSKAVTASYAVTASRLANSNVGQNGQPVYFQNGVPVADTKTRDIVNWVVANSGSISGATGSSADTNVQVQELVGKSGSWESASDWVGNNSSSISNTITKVNNLKGISFAAGATRITASYNPTSSQVIINIPSNPGHIGAASASHNHTFDQITDGTAISASVKRLEVSASSIKNSYVTTASFNNFTQSVANGFLPITGGTLTGNLETKDVFIGGNLTVGGTTTTIDAQNLNIKDKLILIASGSTTQAAANGAGIAVSTASAGEGGAARIQYLSSGNKFTSSVAFEAPSFTGSLKGTATNAVSASYASNASSATSASYAKNSDKTVSASYASSSTTASYALVAESVKDASGLTVKSADTASYVEWNNVSGHPTFVSATFRTGTFSPATYNPVGSAQTINIPTTTDHIAGLNAITQSVKQMVDRTASWDGVASTASAAYQSASKALATASVAQREAESASYWKTEASKSAANASTYADEAAGSMEDARFYSSQAATNATLSSTYAVQSSASAQLAAASASAAATSATNAANYATRAQQSASNAHTSKTLAAASASAAAASASAAAASANAASSSAATAANWAVSASASANQIQADTTVAANWASSSSKYATNASASAALMYKSVGSATQPVYMTTDGPTAATAYSAASVKEAVTASNVTVGAVNTNANLPVLIAAAATPANPSPVKYDTNLTYNASTNRLNVTHVNATGLTGSLRGNVVGNVTGNLTGTASFATSASRAISAASADSATTASYALIAEAVKDGAGLVVNTASYALDAAIKFDGHYAPSSSGAGTSGSSTARYYVKTIKVDGKGHVVGVTTGNETVTNTDTKVTAVGNHYTPTQSTGKAASAGSVISGLGLDAAGHVVSITGSSTIASASRAVSASRADSAASATSATSASYSSYAGNAGQLAGQAASAYALKSYADGAYLPITGGVVTGDLTVQKNFTVAGTTSYLNTTDLVVKDKLILVSSGSTTQANSDGAGIAIQTASATTVANAEKAAARFQYRSSDNKFTASVGIVAPDFTGNLTGTASYTTKAGSADSATVATGLGVAGNTSASVAAAIAAKWTYNENTIKAVKVTSASRADSAATADSATTATTSSYNKAGADALAWITANSASATTNTDRYVNTAAFASTGSNGANGVKMTLTRAGSDTAQVTAVIPVASATAAGVVTGAQLKSWTSGSSWVGANSASIATAVTNNHTHSNKAVLDGISAADTASWDSKWTYNEATIKAVKVTSASRADSAASATSATTATGLGTAANTSASVAAAITAAGKLGPVTAYDYANGYLVTTNITGSSSTMFRFKIEGNSYSGTAAPINTDIQFYSYNNNSIISATGRHLGYDFGNVVAMVYNGFVCIWFSQPAQWQTFAVSCQIRNSSGRLEDCVTTITNVAKPTSGIQREVTITPSVVATMADVTSSSHTHSNKALLDSLTNAKTGSWDTAATNSHTHSNKAVLDGITAAKTASWDAKQAAISDLTTIRSNATNGNTAYGWGNHANAGYAKPADITSAVSALVTASGSKWSTDNDTKVTSAANHYTPAKAGTSGSSTARYYIKTIDVDAKGHVTGVTTGNETVTNTDTKVTAVGNHYTPAQSTAKSVSSGQAVFGIGLDAAGHVVSVTGSNTITSASRAASAASADSATVATGLGVVANTSASVAAAINAKWTYNENTIKGVKVTSASRADLAATAGSATSASRAVSAASADSVAWGNVSGKPSTFAPSAHEHNYLVAIGGSGNNTLAAIQAAFNSVPKSKGVALRSMHGSHDMAFGWFLDGYGYESAYGGWFVSQYGNPHWVGVDNGTWIEGDFITTLNFGTQLAGYTSSWASAAANSHTHSNKSVLDGITSTKVSNWDTAYGWGNHANAGYVKSSGVTSIATGTGLTGGPITSTGTMSIAAATLGKIESGSTAFGWGNHANAGYVKSSGVTSVTIKATSPIAVSSTAAITGTGERTISVASGYAIPTTTQIANFSSATSSVHTHSNKAVLDGITAAMTASWQTAANNNHTHSNKAVLDGITAAKTASWDAAKPGTVTSVTLTTSSNYVVVDNVAAITTSGTRKIDLTETTKGKIENGSSAFEGNTIPYAESSVHSGTIPLTRGQYKNCGVLTGDVTFTFANSFGDGRSTIYAGRFYWSPSQGYSVTFPSQVKWLDSSVDLGVQGWYEFNILDNIGIMVSQAE